MNATLWRYAWRYHARGRAQLLLSIAGIALGVAVVLAVDLASRSALRAFELTKEQVSSRATHRIVASRGALDETVYRVVKVDAGVVQAAPLIDADIFVPRLARTVRLIGVDPLAELGFGEGAATRAASAGATRSATLGGGDEVFVSQSLAGLAGTALTLEVAGRRKDVTVTDVLVAAAAPSGEYVVTDIATAQDILGRYGELDQIELALSDAQAELLQARLPAGAILQRADAGSNATAAMLTAFRTNLMALSLLAVVVGALLIYSGMSFAVVRRRRQLGTLRALGLTQRQLVLHLLGEAALIGIAGTAVGLIAGAYLSGTLVARVLATMNDLYFRTQVGGVEWPVVAFVSAGLLGIAATLAGAVAPALDIARQAPRTALERGSEDRALRPRLRQAPLFAAICAALAVALLAWPRASLALSFAGLFLALMAYAVLLPGATAMLLRALQRPLGAILGAGGRLAIRAAEASLRRTGVAVTVLSVAVATLIGIGVMIDSFRLSVTDWFDSSLLADYYLAPTPDADAKDGAGFSGEDLDALAALPGVTGLSLTRTEHIATPTGVIALRAHSPGPKGYGETAVDDATGRIPPAFENEAAVLLSEPFAARSGLSRGDTLSLPTTSGVARFSVVAVVRDYRSSDSDVIMRWPLFQQHWGPLPPRGVGVYGGNDDLHDGLLEFVAARGGLRVASNAELRDLTLAVFDRTFAVTGVLRLLVGGVAFLGVLAALLALQLERARELATLRAVGLTRRQLQSNTLVQTTLLGATAGLLALPLGCGLALLLVNVINRRSFGWTMDFTVSPMQLVAGLGLAVAAALLAGIYPARRLSYQNVAADLRAE